MVKRYSHFSERYKADALKRHWKAQEFQSIADRNLSLNDVVVREFTNLAHLKAGMTGKHEISFFNSHCHSQFINLRPIIQIPMISLVGLRLSLLLQGDNGKSSKVRSVHHRSPSPTETFILLPKIAVISTGRSFCKYCVHTT